MRVNRDGIKRLVVTVTASAGDEQIFAALIADQSTFAQPVVLTRKCTGYVNSETTPVLRP
jgi:hypothetical protein